MAPNDRIILRDLAIFQVKLFLDGVKDIVLAPLAGIAALVDVLVPGNGGGQRFYAVIRMGERFDRWLNLYSAAEHAGENEEGLLGGERAPVDSMLGRIESILFDRQDDTATPSGATHGDPAV